MGAYAGVVIAIALFHGTATQTFTVWISSSYGERTTPELIELFHEERSTFEDLRELIREDEGLEVRTQSYSYEDPCDTCPPTTRRPRGVAARACDWPNGCSRWVDEPPTPAILSGIAGIDLARATRYLDGLARIEALTLREEHDGSIVFWMETRGIIPSGSATMIAWVPEGVAPHSSDQGICDGWSIRIE